jgi:uncharacterized membrane protein YkoI
MRRFIRGLGASALLGLLAAAAWGQETKVPLDKVPKAVMKTVKDRFPGAELKGAGTEKEEGKVVYEVALVYKGDKYDVTLTPEGAITVMEKTIAAKALPKAVRQALRGKYPKATYERVEEVIQVKDKDEKLAYYEVLLTTADKKKFEVEVAPDGKIMKETSKDKKKE